MRGSIHSPPMTSITRSSPRSQSSREIFTGGREPNDVFAGQIDHDTLGKPGFDESFGRLFQLDAKHQTATAYGCKFAGNFLFTLQSRNAVLTEGGGMIGQLLTIDRFENRAMPPCRSGCLPGCSRVCRAPATPQFQGGQTLHQPAVPHPPLCPG